MAASEVLVVDDDLEVREVVADCLREGGYTVYEAPDGQPALERLRTHPEGLVVILDLWMSGMDGFAVLQTAAEESPIASRHAFILFSATAKNLSPKVAELLKKLKVSVLSKPFDIDELQAAVQKAASRLREPSR